MKKLILSLYLSLILLASCERNEVVIHAEKPAEVDEYALVRQDLSLVAPALARLVSNDAEIRFLLKEEAMKQFDGDYDILFSNIRDFKLSNGQTFGQRLTQEVLASPECIYKIPEILDRIPKFQIAVPVLCSEWDAKSYAPMVAASNYGINESESHWVYGHDGKNVPVAISTDEDPEFPVIVVGVSERVDESGNVLPQFLSHDDELVGPLRVNGEVEQLHRFRLDDLNWWEEWINGKPEIRVRILHVTGTGQTGTLADAYNKFYHPERSQVSDNKWHIVNTHIFSWVIEPLMPSTVTFSDRIRLYWYEEDNGATTTRTLTMPSATIKVKDPTSLIELTVPITASSTTTVTQTDKDENGGADDIWFNEAKTTIYSTGVCDFQMN